MKENNFKYVLKNVMGTTNWLYDIKEFFGYEETERFCDYYINKHKINDKKDIRNVINHNNLSVYSCSNSEQLAFISIYKPFDTTSKALRNIKDGFEKMKNLYKNKKIEFTKKIKLLGYSFTTTQGYWKDKKEKNTYYYECIFVIFSEKVNPDQFKNDICSLAKEYNVKSVLITGPIDNEPKSMTSSKIYDVSSKEIIQEYTATTLDVLERYFSNQAKTKFVFNVPYENNKTILRLGEREILEYYTLSKQKLVKDSAIHSFNNAMYKQYLLNEFSKQDYNN